jgi:hypothetical protein
MNQIKATPVVGSIGSGLIASLCCGGSLVFASIGLGAFYGALGLSRYIPKRSRQELSALWRSIIGSIAEPLSGFTRREPKTSWI